MSKRSDRSSISYIRWFTAIVMCRIDREMVSSVGALADKRDYLRGRSAPNRLEASRALEHRDRLQRLCASLRSEYELVEDLHLLLELLDALADLLLLCAQPLLRVGSLRSELA